MRPMTPIASPHPSLALPNHVAYQATQAEVAAMYRRAREITQEAATVAAPNTAAAPSKAVALSGPLLLSIAEPKVLSKSEQATAAVAYSKAHGVSVLQAVKTLGFAS